MTMYYIQVIGGGRSPAFEFATQAICLAIEVFGLGSCEKWSVEECSSITEGV
jgi:hypothetical protein